MGESDATRGGVLALLGVARKKSQRVTADVLFERGDAFLKGSAQRLSVMHAADRRALDALLAQDVTAQFGDRLRESGIASETAMLHLLRAGRKRLETNPDAVAIIYEAAVQMGATLRDSPRELVLSLEAQAYKGRANALRILGKFEEALTCLAQARERFIDAAYCTDEAGQVDYTRATILAAMELWDDALPATQSACRSFIQAGNTRWAAKAEQLEAVLVFEQGDVDVAHAKWVRLTKVLAALRDREDLARVWLNLGICETLRKRPADARRWLVRARTAFQQLDNLGELARTRWNMGTYLATFEDGQHALRSFTSAYRGFLGLRMWLDAGCVALDMLDTMIDVGAPDDELTLTAGNAADTLARAGLRGIETALDELRKIARQDDRHRIVRIVRAALLDAKASCSEVSFAALGEAG
jgi:tetratricopeptide (TPR) repeat protein